MKPAIGIAIGLACVAAVVALVLTPGQGSLARAAENMRDQNVRMELEMGFSEEGEDVSMTGTALSTADGARMKMDVRMTSSEDEVPTDMAMLMIRDDTWYSFKDSEGLLPDGKRWVHSVDTSTAPTTMTMAEFADFLAGADEVSSEGDTTIDGKPVEHFQGKVNAREVAEETGGDTAKRFEDLLGDRDLFLPIEAWIGEDGLPVRLSMNVDAGEDSMSITAKILEYGIAVDVEAPPAAETIEESELNLG